MSSTTSDEYIDSEDASGREDSDDQRSSEAASGQGREAHALEQWSRQDEPTPERTVSQSRKLVNEPDSVVETSERQPGKRKSRQGESSQEQTRKPKGNKSRSTESRRQKVNGHLSARYRDLLNEVINEYPTHSERGAALMASSRIGASYWSSDEKACLFEQLKSSNLGNLPSLQKAVPTKSESEIQSYLLLLHAALPKQSSLSGFKHDVALVDIPAALEISEDCERYLDLAADALAARVNEHDIEVEQSHYGEEWLIDSEAAAELDAEFEWNEDGPAPAVDLPDDKEIPDSPTASTHEPLQQSAAAAEVLRPSAFLELSRNLFMNNGEDADLNWRTFESLADSSEEPAMFRSTLEDFYSLVVSHTRRLVQATIFQAMTRLRASDSSRKDWSPAARVRECDVWSALDILDWKADPKPYWADAPRRCKVMPFTDSARYKDGRPGTKTGYGLTFDEAEAELGLQVASPAMKLEDAQIDMFEEDIDEYMGDSDVFTNAGHSDDDAQGLRNAKSESDHRSRSRSRTRKRKRELSPASFCRAENRYVEAFDRKDAEEEEERLFKMLRHNIPDAPSGTESRMPMSPGPVPGSEKNITHWRSKIEYEAEWEHPFGLVPQHAFGDMEVRGRLGRKRRRLIERQVRHRLESDAVLKHQERDSGEDVESDGDGNDHAWADHEEVADTSPDAMEMDRKHVGTNIVSLSRDEDEDQEGQTIKAELGMQGACD